MGGELGRIMQGMYISLVLAFSLRGSVVALLLCSQQRAALVPLSHSHAWSVAPRASGLPASTYGAGLCQHAR